MTPAADPPVTVHEGRPVLAGGGAAAGRRAQRRPGRPRRLRLLAARLLRRLDPRRPHIDRLAANGLRYTNFHITALCSPTRASLLTGRNHHAVGMGDLADFDTGFRQRPRRRHAQAPRPWPRCCAPHGYSTFAVGKWHLAPLAECSPVGPFGHWPTPARLRPLLRLPRRRDRPVAPELWRGPAHRHRCPTAPGYHLSEDLVDQAIRLPRRPAERDARPAVLPLPRVRRLPLRRTRRRPPFIEPLPRPRSTQGWDADARERSRAPEGAGHRARRTPRCPPQRRRAGLGRQLDDDERAAAVPRCRRSTPASSTTPTRRSAGWSTYLEELGSLDNTLVVADVRQRRQPRGRRSRLGERVPLLQRPARHARREPGSDRPARRARDPQPLSRPAGRRPATRRSSGTRRTPTAAASAIR